MKRIIAAFTASVLAAAAFAVPAGAADTDTLPSGMTVGALSEVLDSMAQAKQDEMPYASASVGVFRGGEILYTGYFGHTDIGNRIAAAEDSVYEWGSISKTFVWVSAMQLREQGKLDLDADIRTYLPEGFFHNLSYDDPITFMNLMNHNAGWQETMRPMEAGDESAVLPLKEALQACEPAQIHRPGEVISYSNYGAALAGYVVECASGTDYCEYVHRNILEPLGMTHTSVNPVHSDNPWVYEQRRKLKCYQCDPFTGNMTDLGSRLSYIMPYPAGAVTGTLADLMKYGQALVDDSAPLFRNPETQKLLFTGTAFRGSSDMPSCCHGFWCEEYGVRVCGHSGATNAGQADLEFDPVSKTGIAVMINEPMGNVFLQAMPSLVFGSLTADRFAGSQETALNGNYLISRSTFRGLYRFIPYLTATSLNEKAYDIGNGIYALGDGNNAMLLSTKTNGVRLEYGSMELIRDDAYIPELSLLTLFMLAAVAALYALRIRHKLKKHKRLPAYPGAAVMSAGYAAEILSVLTMLGSYVAYSAYGGGIPFAAGAAVGVIQLACMAVCAVSAVTAVLTLFSEKEKARPYIYIISAVLNAVTISAVLYYEMYVFWGC